MDLNTVILDTAAAYQTLRNDWNRLVLEDPLNLAGQDGTSTFEWFETILASFAEASESRVIAVYRGDELQALLPLIIDRTNRIGPRLRLPTELYGGRNGPIMCSAGGEVLEALLDGLDKACPGWISLQLTMLATHRHTAAFLGIVERRGHAHDRGAPRKSPFFSLQESSAVFKSGVSKSVQQMLRTSRNKFSKIGNIQFREYRHEAESTALIELVLAIERGSWKHAAGTAISTQARQEAFYRALFPLAMRHGLLLAEVLELDNIPIAYNFGLLNQQVYCCLKHSNLEIYDKLSPSYLVNESLIERLRAAGVVSFDFMGLPDAHKLRWSSQTGFYTRHTWTIFSQSPKGRLAAVLLRLKNWLVYLRPQLKANKQGPAQ